MPVISGGTPTVSVSVPVPTPVQTQKKPPVNFGGDEPAAPQQPIGPTGVPPALRPKRQLAGVILPWSPAPEQKQMRRLPVKVIRYGASHDDVSNLLGQISSNPEHSKPGAHMRLIAADALDDLGRSEEANRLRSNGRVFVANGVVKPMPHHVEIRGRRWFQRRYGNTYHVSHAYIDGKHVLSVPRQYGYGNQYADTMMGALEKQGLVPPRTTYSNGSPEAMWQWAERHGINLDTSAEEVQRQRHLNDPPPPSRYVPPSSSQEKLSRKGLPVKVIKLQ